jgi:peptide/nickel transport system substrate-binding protein
MMNAFFARAAAPLARFLRLLVVLALATSFASCAHGAGASSRDPGTLVDLEQADASTFNPLYQQSAYDSIYASLVFDGLTNIGPGYRIVPGLATAWRHSADGLHWDVDLRRGVRWSDGLPFTSADVVFTYRTMLHPKTAFNQVSYISYVRRVVADGPYRVHFDLTAPSATFVTIGMGFSILPVHLLGAVRPERQAFTDFGEHPVGTGAYRLVRWQHDSEVLFARNPYSWRGLAHIPRLDIRIIFNDQAEIDALESGSADMISDLGFTQAERLARESPRVKRLTFAPIYIGIFQVNLRRAGLSDVRVRRALMFAFDRPALTRGFFDDQVSPVNTLIAPGLTSWYNPHTRSYPYDPARARRILDAAGWKLGPDGVRQKRGKRLAFEVLVNQGSVLILDQLLALSADAAAVGIQLNARQIDFASAVARTYKGNFDLLFEAFGGSIDPDSSAVLASDQQPPVGSNVMGYDSPAVDRDLRAGLRELDDVKRRVIYDDMQEHLAEDLPMLWLYGRYAASAFGERVHIDSRATLQSPYVWYNLSDWTLGS